MDALPARRPSARAGEKVPKVLRERDLDLKDANE